MQWGLWFQFSWESEIVLSIELCQGPEVGLPLRGGLGSQQRVSLPTLKLLETLRHREVTFDAVRDESD